MSMSEHSLELSVTGSDTRHRLQRHVPGLLLFVYALSGMVSLAFEVLWARMLSLQFGVSIFGVVVTIAAFMLGLGGGSLLAGYRGYTIRSPLRWYAWLEGGVALYALLLPWLLHFVDGALQSIAADSGLSIWFAGQVLAMLLIMLLPALAMGAGFPLVLRVSSQLAIPLGKIYGVNAAGGALGALLPLVALPLLGWTHAVWLVAAAGCIICLLALYLSYLCQPLLAPPHSMTAAISWPAVTTLWAYAGVGAAAIMLEVGWTRLYGMVMLRTEYVMAVIVAVYLLGIGLGSLLARYMHGHFWYTLLAGLTAVTGVATLWVLPWLSMWLEQTQFAGLASALIGQSMILALLTLPATLMLGAWLPLLAARLGNHDHHGACLYGVNSIGAACGALVAGFVLIPYLGTAMTIVIASFLLLLMGAVWAGSRQIWWLLPLLAVLSWPVAEMAPASQLLPVAHANSHDLYRYEDAIAVTQVVEQADGQRVLLSDLQRMDASTEAAAVELQKNQARLPLMLKPHAQSVLFLGLGTGITASGSLVFPLQQRTAVELSQGAINAAASWFAEANGHVMDRLTVIRNDSRRYLKTQQQQFDVIIGDVFHPDLVGRSALLSVQQFRRVASHLHDGGLYVQWLALNQFDVTALQVVLRSFQRVFPDASMFIDGFRMALLGHLQPGRLAVSQHQALQVLGDDERSQATGGEGRWTWLGRYWGTLELPSGPVQSEWFPSIEFSLPGARYRGDVDIQKLMHWLLARRPTPELAARQLGVSAAEYQHFERAYIASELALRSWLASLEGNTAEANRLIRFAHQANPGDRWAGMTLADSMFATVDQVVARGVDRRDALQAILRIRPDHVEALRSLWKLEQRAGRSGMAQQYLQRLRQLSPYDREISRQQSNEKPSGA